MKNLIVAITGAGGALYAKTLLQLLPDLQQEGQIYKVGIVLSKNAYNVWKWEFGEDFSTPKALRCSIYLDDDFFAEMASGSGTYSDMLICPCSMGTLARIANGISDSLITRAADVMLKERRCLVLAIRETPLNLIHLRNMTQLTEAGAIVAPLSPGLYDKPQDLNELAQTMVKKLLSLINISTDAYRWGDTKISAE